MEIKYKEEITSSLSKHAKDDGVAIQKVIDDLTELIVETKGAQNLNALKATWTKRIKCCASLLDLDVALDTVNWGSLESKLEASPKTTSQSNSRSKSSCPTLKTLMTEENRAAFEKAYQSLDKSKFLTLSATRKDAEASNTVPVPIEEKIYNFGKKAVYLHPCHSFILDLQDQNWQGELTKEELEELKSLGNPLVRATPEPLKEVLSAIKDMSTKEIYTYSRAIDHDPSTDHLLTWLSLTLANTASMFLCSNTGFGGQGEADVMYEKWCLLKSVLRGSKLTAYGKEITSKASRDSANAKRKLSAVEPIENVKLGRRMDDIYCGGDMEYGCMEIGHHDDPTKMFHDGQLKLPLVMKEMLLKITDYAPELTHQVHIVGYSINGSSIQQLDMDCPGGYVTRIRRSAWLSFPSSVLDYKARISSVLKIAANGRTIMEETQQLYSNYEIPLEPAISTVLPRCLSEATTPASDTSSKKSKNTSSTS